MLLISRQTLCHWLYLTDRIYEHKMLKWSSVKSIAYHSYFSVALWNKACHNLLDVTCSMTPKSKSDLTLRTSPDQMYSHDSFRSLACIDSQRRTLFSVWGLNSKRSPHLSNISAAVFTLRKLLWQATLSWVSKAYLGEWDCKRWGLKIYLINKWIVGGQTVQHLYHIKIVKTSVQLL